VELDLRWGAKRGKNFANSPRIHEDVDATSGGGNWLRSGRAFARIVPTTSPLKNHFRGLATLVCLRFVGFILCLRSVVEEEYSEDAYKMPIMGLSSAKPQREVPSGPSRTGSLASYFVFIVTSPL